MLTDLETVATGTSFQSDVCIIGAGIAGLVLANKLAGYGLNIHLLEAGGLDFEARSQKIYESEMRGSLHTGTMSGRFRTFGGSSTRWGGQLIPFSPEIFEFRSTVGNLSWPISPSDFQNYYPEILAFMGVDSLPFDEQFLQHVGSKAGIGTGQVRIRFSKFAPFSKRNLGKTIGRACLASPQITVFLHANAVSVDLNAEGTLTKGITVRTYQGAQHTFTAREYVVCTGTIETSRLLLNSNAVHATGIGNSNDLLGRYFHDHISVNAASLAPADVPAFVQHFTPYYVKGTIHTPKLEATAALQKDQSLLAVHAHFFIQEPENSGIALLRRALVDFQNGQIPLSSVEEFRQLPRLLMGAAKTAYSVKFLGRRFPSSQANIAVAIDTEQRPKANSRILLSDQRDALGLRKTVVDWKCSADEEDTVYRFSSVIENHLASFGMRQLRWRPERADGPRALLQCGNDVYHPMGGARMGTSVQDSVVRNDLRLHDVQNLYVASCAVFPTGGSSGPTFTLMALTLRLADLLRTKLRS